jgi:copper chaperone CopZ
MENVVNFYVQNMKCDGCIKKASEALQVVPGFESVEFDLKQGTATVTGAVDPQSVIAALTETGYPAVVKSD